MSAGFAERLAALSRALGEGAAFWRARPFIAEPAWLVSEPEVAAWCERLSPAAVCAIEHSERLPADAPAVLRAWQDRLAPLTALPTLTLSTSPRATRSVPGRKAMQIAAFSAALGGVRPAAVLDWCGGKGHLGRALAQRWAVPLTVLEREAGYRDEAVALAGEAGVALRFVAADALAAPDGLFADGVLVVGLHACGELGDRLLLGALAADVHALALAPCCLHKVRGVRQHGFRPLSAAGRAVDPGFDHASLRLATADEVVARPRLRASRQRDNAWRLGLDLLARTAGASGYRPLDQLADALAMPDFVSFVRAAAARHAIALPRDWDALAAERTGYRLAERARALGLARGLFKRAVEVWCALDRAALLAENGLAVSVCQFTERAVTPRNILLLASQRHGLTALSSKPSS